MNSAVTNINAVCVPCALFVALGEFGFAPRVIRNYSPGFAQELFLVVLREPYTHLK